MILRKTAIAFIFPTLLLAQNSDLEQKVDDLPEKGAQLPNENQFQDPFENPAPEISPPTEEYRPSREMPEPAFSPEPFVPPPERAPAPPAERMPAPPADSNPSKAFDFPDVEDVQGPISRDYLESKKVAEEVKAKTWNIGVNLGGGINLARRNQQVHLETSGGYRFNERFEVDGIVYYRFVKDSLIGFSGVAKYSYTLRNDPSMRIDILPLAGLGWTMRKPPSATKFSEGRMNIRVGSDYLFYPFPKFALTATTAIETFLFSLTTGGSGTNFFSKGLPIQLLLTLGTRWEF